MNIKKRTVSGVTAIESDNSVTLTMNFNVTQMAFDSGATTMKSDISATLIVNPQCRTGDMPCMGVTGEKMALA